MDVYVILLVDREKPQRLERLDELLRVSLDGEIQAQAEKVLALRGPADSTISIARAQPTRYSNRIWALTGRLYHLHEEDPRSVRHEPLDD